MKVSESQSIYDDDENMLLLCADDFKRIIMLDGDGWIILWAWTP